MFGSAKLGIHKVHLVIPSWYIPARPKEHKTKCPLFLASNFLLIANRIKIYPIYSSGSSGIQESSVDIVTLVTSD